MYDDQHTFLTSSNLALGQKELGILPTSSKLERTRIEISNYRIDCSRCCIIISVSLHLYICARDNKEIAMISSLPEDDPPSYIEVFKSTRKWSLDIVLYDSQFHKIEDPDDPDQDEEESQQLEEFDRDRLEIELKDLQPDIIETYCQLTSRKGETVRNMVFFLAVTGDVILKEEKVRSVIVRHNEFQRPEGVMSKHENATIRVVINPDWKIFGGVLPHWPTTIPRRRSKKLCRSIFLVLISTSLVIIFFAVRSFEDEISIVD